MGLTVRDLVPAFLTFWENGPRRLGSVRRAIPGGAAALVAPLLEAEHVDIRGVSMVGLGTANGWFAGGTLYLAVEQIPDERAARILASHEIAHALQLPLPATPWPDDGTLGCAIYSEGFATALTEAMGQLRASARDWR